MLNSCICYYDLYTVVILMFPSNCNLKLSEILAITIIDVSRTIASFAMLWKMKDHLYKIKQRLLIDILHTNTNTFSHCFYGKFPFNSMYVAACVSCLCNQRLIFYYEIFRIQHSKIEIKAVPVICFPFFSFFFVNNL